MVDDKFQQEQMLKILPEIGAFLEMKAKELYKYKKEQRNFVLSMATNLLGNLAIQWSDDSVEAKLMTSSSVVQNLVDWFGISIKEYKIRKESH